MKILAKYVVLINSYYSLINYSYFHKIINAYQDAMTMII